MGGPDGEAELAARSYELLVFERATAASGEGFGLQVFDSAGALSFDSGHANISVGSATKMTRGNDTRPAAPWVLGAGTLSIPSALQGKAVAILCSPFFWGINNTTSGFMPPSATIKHIYMGGIRKHSSTQLKTFVAHVGNDGPLVPGVYGDPIWESRTIPMIDADRY